MTDGARLDERVPAKNVEIGLHFVAVLRAFLAVVAVFVEQVRELAVVALYNVAFIFDDGKRFAAPNFAYVFAFGLAVNLGIDASIVKIRADENGRVGSVFEL